MIVDRGHLGTRMGKSCHVHMFCWLILVVVIASSQVTRLVHELPSPLHVANVQQDVHTSRSFTGALFAARWKNREARTTQGVSLISYHSVHDHGTYTSSDSIPVVSRRDWESHGE